MFSKMKSISIHQKLEKGHTSNFFFDEKDILLIAHEVFTRLGEGHIWKEA